MVTLTQPCSFLYKWKLSIEVAKTLAKALKESKRNSIEYTTILLPIKKAIQDKQTEVSFVTANYSLMATILEENSISIS